MHIADVMGKRGDTEADELIESSNLSVRRKDDAKKEIRRRMAQSNEYWDRYDAGIAAGMNDENARTFAHDMLRFKTVGDFLQMAA